MNAKTFRIPEEELEFRAVRASGPGGQHVNTSATKVEVRWNVDRSESLTVDQRERLRERLGPRVSRRGVIRVTADDERSQRRNRILATERLGALVQDALTVPTPRKTTKPPKAARESRLEQKKRRSEQKSLRRPPNDEW